MASLRRLAFLALLAAPLALFVETTSAAAFKRAHEGDPAPAFTLPDVAGTPVDLNDYKDGPLTILSFWALWSPKSEPLLRDIQRLLDEFGEKGVRALGLKAVSVNAEGQTPPADLEQQVQQFAEKNGLKFPMLIDKKLEQYDAWGVIALPATALLGKDLKIVYEFSGHPTSAYQDMREKVMEVLGVKDEVAAAQKPKRERYKPASKTTMLAYGLSKTLFERGKLSDAAKKLEKVLADEPKFPEAHALSGAIQLAAAKDDKPETTQGARDSFAKAVELDSTVPMGLAGLAHFALRDGDVPKALELAKKAHEYADAPAAPRPAAPRGEGKPREGIVDTAAPTEQRTMKEGVKLRDITAEAPAGEAKTEEKAPEAPAPAGASDVATLLASAEKALGAGDAKAAAADLERAVGELLGTHQGPKMKKEGLIEKVNKQ